MKLVKVKVAQTLAYARFLELMKSAPQIKWEHDSSQRYEGPKTDMVLRILVDSPESAEFVRTNWKG